MSVLTVEYLATRLLQLGCNYVFSVSGDYCADFLENCGSSTVTTPNKKEHATPNLGQLQRIGNTNEQEAAYAAEGWAKATDQLSATCTTYGVGTFNVLNGCASALVENVPLVVINGSPSLIDFQKDAQNGILYHHMITGGRLTELKIFEQVTVAQQVLGSAAEIPLQIDQLLLAAIVNRQPVYLEVPEDKWFAEVTPASAPLVAPGSVVPAPFPVTESGVSEAVEAVWTALNDTTAEHPPLLLAGVELERFGLRSLFEELLVAFEGVPLLKDIKFASTGNSKGVISESNEHFSGIVFEGTMSSDAAKTLLNTSSYWLQLGVWLTDLVIGGSNTLSDLIQNKQFHLAQKGVVSGNGRELYTGVPLALLLEGLIAKAKASTCGAEKPAHWNTCNQSLRQELVALASEQGSDSVTYDSFVKALTHDKELMAESVVAVDATLAFFASLVLPVERAQWYVELMWGSIGWTSGASIGIAFGVPDKRVLTLIGDGGFMNCCTGISTAARHNLNITYCVFSNGVYAIDQFLVNPAVFAPGSTIPFPDVNTLAKWDWVKFGEALGATAFRASTNAELLCVLEKLKSFKGTAILELVIPERTVPSILTG